MLLWLTNFLTNFYHPFYIFNNVSLRCILAAATALIISLVLGKPMISWLKRLQVGQVIRQEGPQTHLTKQGTPTMGGVLIIASILIASLLWAKLSNFYIWVLIFTLVLFGMIGFLDDFLKLVLNHSKGLKSRWKYLLQSLLGLLVGIVLFFHFNQYMDLSLAIPYTQSLVIPLGAFSFIILSYFVTVGSSNAVNLTDGLDGLAIVPIGLVALGLAVFAYATGNATFAYYLHLEYIPHTEEIAIFLCAIFGASLGFLWFNTHPADVFMGDVGALALGAALGVAAIIVRQELVLFIMGFIFVVETVSVILQVGSYKLRKKRIFKMAPIHHHFEQLGLSETKVTVRFWIVTILCVLIGLASLKI
ncbi:phospho-N-acetylmuramoyl-pentapeptide-transferase [Thiotrichales bacterium 19S9-12]|nr:phospho-N-acetylmuramoyl-pentapeptide-transferase [Thiotrichales bacterium 19S9-11]MCF6811708.1 phospho-N-acetylmuramoyl-pentapeptide-transferase [Thiotrichales bacterium 19S9-12]